MALVDRQKNLYTFRVELYTPSVITTHASGNRATDRAADEGWAAPPAYVNVSCYYASAEEATQPMMAGLQSEANLFTFYNFYFEAAQKVGNGWAIRLTQPGHPDDGNWFYVQDKPKTTVSAGHRAVNQNTVFATRGPSPLLVSTP